MEHTKENDPEYELKVPPKPNWEFCFGGDWYACTISLYYEKPPNRFQRWAMQKFLGIYWRQPRS